MILKKIFFLHILPVIIVVIAVHFFIKLNRIQLAYTSYINFSAKEINENKGFDKFYPNEIKNQVSLAISLKRGIPVLFGSSELTSTHLSGIASNFFNNNKGDKFLSVGHAGFQNFSILSVLAANKSVLKNSKITIILSPGWFEKQFCKGTSIASFFEFCPPNYLYQIYKDTSIDKTTKKHIQSYLYANYDKINSPDAVLRLMSKNQTTSINSIFNYPLEFLNNTLLKQQEKLDAYLISQKQILDVINNYSVTPYLFRNKYVNWDSLKFIASHEFKLISNNNLIGVQNDYYNNWLKNKPKKVLHVLDIDKNNEYKDFTVLINFLKNNNIKPLFVIMPLNSLAHKNLEVLAPTVKSINDLLVKNNFTTLDMFTPNLKNYQIGVLEDIMHPYNVGWYQIDKFILENYHD